MGTVDERRIAKKVLAVIGEPIGFKLITAKNIYGNKYRVNVYCEKSDSLRITHSYIVVTDNRATNIISSDPKLQEIY